MPKKLDEEYMSLAIRLAKKAEGMTSPNPNVGAVLVKNGKIIGRGFHRQAGLPHAEVEAFLDAKEKGHDVEGSTLYVTLEPCCHREKRTPPCAGTIIERGITRVVAGTLDPNPRVRGKGIEALRKAGIRAEVGVLEEKCREINQHFFKYITTGIPFVVLKLAATLDGKIAAASGDSRWVGSERQRRYAHELRRKADAIVVGVETVIRDDPQLSVRYGSKKTRQPRPVILDSKLRIPINSRLFKIHSSPIIATTHSSDSAKVDELEKMGARVLRVDRDKEGGVDISELAKRLGEFEITSVLIEGGSQVAASALKGGIVDKIIFFYAPKIIGAEGISMIGKLDLSRMNEAFSLYKIRVKKIGEEFIVEGYPANAISCIGASKILQRL